MKTDKFTGPNKVLLILGQRTCAHRDDCLELKSHPKKLKEREQYK